eukprot:26139-Alexandrium_andersonii.AAC.1
MSASLVGSEMCIRDSAQAPHPCSDLSVHLCPPRTSTTSLFRYRVAGAAPVSYTHLTLPTICSV